MCNKEQGFYQGQHNEGKKMKKLLTEEMRYERSTKNKDIYKSVSGNPDIETVYIKKGSLSASLPPPLIMVTITSEYLT